MKENTPMKNRLAIAFALILCFASMTFAGTSNQPASQGGKATSPLPVTMAPPDLETDVNLVQVENDDSLMDYFFLPIDFKFFFLR
ncbi:MAG: hypothetical protein WBP93_03920 [Pyrinomonadaceae bacterium]